MTKVINASIKFDLLESPLLDQRGDNLEVWSHQQLPTQSPAYRQIYKDKIIKIKAQEQKKKQKHTNKQWKKKHFHGKKTLKAFSATNVVDVIGGSLLHNAQCTP